MVVADVSEQGPGNGTPGRGTGRTGARRRVRRVAGRGRKAALDKTVEAFGRLDIAFNNAGVEQPLKPAAELAVEEWDRIVDINLRGVFLCMKHEIP